MSSGICADVRNHRRRCPPSSLPSGDRFRRGPPRCRASRSPCRAGAGGACSAATSRARSRSPRRAGAPSSCARAAAAGCRGSCASPRSSARRPVTQRKRRASASSSWMYSLYSLSVVAATIRISPRASTDLKTLAASDGAPSAEPAPTMVCASSTNRIRFGRSFSSRMTFWIRSSNMPRSIVPATIAVHLQVDDLAVAQAHRHRFRLELDAARQPFGDRRLADAGLADQHHRVGALAVAEDLEHLLDFLVAAEDRRQLVLPREQVQVGGEVLEERRQLEALLQPLLAQLHVAHPRGQARHQHVRLDAVAPENRHRHALRFLEDRGEEVGRLDGLAAGAAGMMQRQLEDELGRRRDAQLASGERRHHVQMLFDRLKNRVRVQFDVAHDLGEHVPFDLREGQKHDVRWSAAHARGGALLRSRGR